MRGLKYLIVLLLAVSCGSRSGGPAAPAQRQFPTVEVPGMVSDPTERLEYITAHFWDCLADTSKQWLSDSSHVAGIASEELERQIGMFTTLLSEIPLSSARKAAVHAFRQFESCPDTAVFPALSPLLERYLYDANSPVRNEDVWQPVAQAMSSSPRVKPGLREAYARDAELCTRNAAGTRAADFTFADARGRRHTLRGIRADLTLLFFSNPGCPACKEIISALQDDPVVTQLTLSGKMAVACVYIDEDLQAWRDYLDHYPSTWLVGYDPDFAIRTDLRYNVRAIPSLYLLDADKTVLLKDATTERVLQTIHSLAESEG